MDIIDAWKELIICLDKNLKYVTLNIWAQVGFIDNGQLWGGLYNHCQGQSIRLNGVELGKKYPILANNWTVNRKIWPSVASLLSLP